MGEITWFCLRDHLFLGTEAARHVGQRPSQRQATPQSPDGGSKAAAGSGVPEAKARLPGAASPNPQ